MNVATLSLLLLLGAGGDFDEAELRQLAAPMEGAGSDAALQQLVDTFLPRVAKAMGGSPSPSFRLRIVSRQEAADKLEALLHREYPGDRLQRLGLALEAVHLVENGSHLGEEAAALYGKNVSGFYDPHDRALYLIRDQPMIAQAMIVPHELAHAVQDSLLHLDSSMSSRRDSEDASLALSAAVEGNAQAVASAVLAEGATDESSNMLSSLSEGIGESAEMAAEESGAPPWLGLQLHFPYSQGLHLVEALRAKGDRSGMQLLRRPPDSTAQVVAPELYLKQERPLVPRGPGLANLVDGGRPVYETTLGRANLDLFGKIHADGATLGEGWRGDRLEVARTGGKVCSLWVVAFTHPEQAELLARAYAHILEAKPAADGRFTFDGGEVRTQGNVTLIIENAPPASIPKIEAAALTVFP